MRISLRNAARDAAVGTREALQGARTALEDSVEDIADPGAAAWRNGRGRGLMRPDLRGERSMTERVGEVWEVYFGHMLGSVDHALAEGWITRDDLAEPFLMLGMPAAAAMELVLLSCPPRVQDAVALSTRILLSAEVIRTLTEESGVRQGSSSRSLCGSVTTSFTVTRTRDSVGALVFN
jgi:hypothetical protein